ncbi:MAG: hypothetical protein GWP42_14170 [Verrucomicrobiales bacterium]|jgi:hypothetical protein|nr:hypothetical protein [Verrucomicrobiales bacterium]
MSAPPYMQKGHTFQAPRQFGHNALVAYKQSDHSSNHAEKKWWKRQKNYESEVWHKKDHNNRWEDAQTLKDSAASEQAADERAELAHDMRQVSEFAYTLTSDQRATLGISQEDLDRIESYADDRDALAIEWANMNESLANAADQGLGEPDVDSGSIWPWLLGGVVVAGGIGILLSRRK